LFLSYDHLESVGEWTMSEASMAEIEDRTPDLPPDAAEKPYRDIDTEIDWEQERLNRDKAIERMLSGRNSDLIKVGIAAYRRELPELLRAQKERHVVAYEGSTRVGIARTREQLFVELKRRGLADGASLFIKIISRLEDNKEDSRASDHRRILGLLDSREPSTRRAVLPR
jgi:hypothetical protein